MAVSPMLAAWLSFNHPSPAIIFCLGLACPPAAALPLPLGADARSCASFLCLQPLLWLCFLGSEAATESLLARFVLHQFCYTVVKGVVPEALQN